MFEIILKNIHNNHENLINEEFNNLLLLGMVFDNFNFKFSTRESDIGKIKSFENDLIYVEYISLEQSLLLPKMAGFKFKVKTLYPIFTDLKDNLLIESSNGRFFVSFYNLEEYCLRKMTEILTLTTEEFRKSIKKKLYGK